MKHTFINSILAIFAMILLAGCSEDITSALQGNDTKTISFNLVQPAWTGGTRAFTGDDVSSVDASNLQLLCFDSDGGFTGIGTGVSSSSATIPNNTKHIHFLYKCATTYSANSYAIGTNEATVLSPNVLTTNDKMVCWAYIDLTNFTSGSTVYLKRNVAKVSVASGDDSKATASLYAVVKDMDKGSIAPFDYKNTSTPFSSSNYNETTGLPSFLTIPLDASRNTTATALADNTTEAYLFETYQNTSNTADSIAVIVKMTYASGTTRYHLMRLMNSEQKLFDIQRNHHYKITMNADIPEKFGYSSPEDALKDGAVPTNSYSKIEVINPWGESEPSIVLLDARGNTLSSVSVYPSLDYNSTKFDLSTSGYVKKKIYFWYKNVTEEVSSLTASDFSASTTISGATATVESFDGTNKYGVVSLSIPNSSLTTAGNVGNLTISRTASGSTITSDALAVSALSWSNAFTSGTINYYIKSADNSVVIKDFSVILSDGTTSVTDGTNLRIASKVFVPSSSMSAFNNVYIDDTPIDGLDYWYNKPSWTSDDLSSMSSALKYTGTVSSTSTEISDNVYVMADGIMPVKVDWNKGTEPTTSYAYITSYKKNNDVTTFTLSGENCRMFTYSGNGTNSEIDYTINNISITNALKLESKAGTISFTTTSEKTLTLYVTSDNNVAITDNSGNTENITQTKTSETVNTSKNATSTVYKITATLPSGQHIIKRGSNGTNIIYIELK